VNFLRPLLAVVVILGACIVSKTYSEHHSHESVFQTLYLHLVPAKLVSHGDHAPGPGQEEAGEVDVYEEVGHGSAEALVAIPLPGFLGIFDLNAHMDGDPLTEPHLWMTNLQIFQIAAVLLVFVLLGGIPSYLRTGRGDALTKLFTGFAMYIREEMVLPVMGKKNGDSYLPYFLGIFFFILFMNLMGLVPWSATATASIYITGALAVITFASMLICGMAVQGPIPFWKNLVPHVPAALWPLMFLVEVIGLVVKPFALMIRLFANMSGGHMVVLSFMGLIFFFGKSMGEGMGYASSPVALSFAVFIMIIEVFVAMLQAYIFTQLSIMFVNASIHPEH